ncbi:conserved hypothetical protein [Ixodes scapularis]|uniref:N-acetyltransferase domain-containing protein n=1 Tax=Ixodes scapularis TaxID=6945 RepID=B7QFU5_IXOSC|nr:conserved hypothetical protein [Ixodes scapularis]|eukprot:XP_002400966.1 conserved hypothetical protein [Ixodes scapularis]
MASVPENLDSKYDLHVVDEDDVAAVLAKAWSDDRTAVVTLALWSFYRCSPNGFYVVRERRKSNQGGEICAAAAVVTFEDEVSFCPFFHLSQERAGYGISRLLWNQILQYCTGKNIVTVMSHEVAAAFLRRYRFNVSATGDIMYGLVKIHSRSFAGSANVRDYQGDRDFRALVDYDRSVFGFGRRHYLKFALAEAEQMVKIATTIGGEICGYVGVQRDQRGCPLLRWLLANDAPTAEGLLHDVVSSCTLVQERGLVAAFYTASPVTNAVLNKVDVSLLEPWVLIYTRREPFCRVDRIVSLTFI